MLFLEFGTSIPTNTELTQTLSIAAYLAELLTAFSLNLSVM